jgi:hypothetical protein
MRVAFLNHPHSEAAWNIEDCVVAAARLVDETIDVVEFSPAPIPPDALIFGGSPVDIKVFPAIPLARVAIASGPPGPAVGATLSVYAGAQPQNFRFRPDELGVAIADLARWLESSLDLGITNTELRKLEVIRASIAQAVSDGMYRQLPDFAAQLSAISETLEAQTRAPHPGRRVIGWCLNQIAAFPVGLVSGVASSYLVELLPHFAR